MFFRKIFTVKILCSLFLLLLFPAYTFAEEIKLGKIDTSKFPQVSVKASFSGRSEVNSKVITLRENGKKVKNFAIKSLSQTSESMAVALIIDTSGSMKGKPLEDAKAAAQTFVNKMDSPDQAAIISFNSTPLVLTDFTSDRAVLNEAIGKLQAGGETAVYDGASIGLDLISQKLVSQKNIVLLSDGADTSSQTSLGPILEKAKNWGVPIYTVALQSEEFDLTNLSKMSEQSGGNLVVAPDSSSLTAFYANLAKELQNQYLLTYKSNSQPKDKIKVEVAANLEGELVKDATFIKVPKSSSILDSPKANKFKTEAKKKLLVDKIGYVFIILTIFASIFLLAFGSLSLFWPQKNILREQMKIYERINKMRKNEGEEALDEENLKSKVLAAVGYLAAKRGFTEYANRKFEQAGLPLKPLEYIFFHFLIVISVGFFALVLTKSLLLSALFISLAVVTPLMVVYLLINRRQALFYQQLPETLSMMAGSLKAGYGLLQAVSHVAKEAMPPISLEFKKILNQARLGLSIEEAMEKMAERVGSETFLWTVMAINIQREIGGNLAEILEILADTIRERERVRRQIKALTAEGRLSAIILFILPFIQGLLLFYINPGYVSLLFTHILGWVMVIFAVMLMVIGAIWLKKIVSIEV